MGKELLQKLNSVSFGFSKTRNEIENNVDLKKYPLSFEPALVHPNNSSTVKIRDNGVIDIFVGTDNGVRIDPENRSVNILSNSYREKTTNHKQEIMRNTSSTIGGDWVVKVEGNVKLESKGEMSLSSNKGVHIDGRTIPEWLDTIQWT
jgi:hypothetical protein